MNDLQYTLLNSPDNGTHADGQTLTTENEKNIDKTLDLRLLEGQENCTCCAEDNQQDYLYDLYELTQ